MRIALGIVLGLVLAALLPPLQALLEFLNISKRGGGDFLDAFAIVTLVLLSVIAVRSPGRRKLREYGYREPLSVRKGRNDSP